MGDCVYITNETNSEYDISILPKEDYCELIIETGAIAIDISEDRSYQVLTSSTSIAMDVRDGQNAKVTLAHNATLTLSNLQDGDEGNIIITQDGTGSRSLAISPDPYVINDGGGQVTLSTDPDAIDIISYTYDGSELYINYGTNYTTSPPD